MSEWNDVRARLTEFEILPLSVSITEMAAVAVVKHHLALADALIYATAKAHGIVLFARDNNFQGLPGVKMI